MQNATIVGGESAAQAQNAQRVLIHCDPTSPDSYTVDVTAIADDYRKNDAQNGAGGQPPAGIMYAKPLPPTAIPFNGTVVKSFGTPIPTQDDRVKSIAVGVPMGLVEEANRTPLMPPISSRSDSVQVTIAVEGLGETYVTLSDVVVDHQASSLLVLVQDITPDAQRFTPPKLANDECRMAISTDALPYIYVVRPLNVAFDYREMVRFHLFHILQVVPQEQVQS